MVLVYLYIIITQFIDNKGEFNDDKTYGIIPLSYSYMNSDRALPFSITLIIFCILLLIVNMIRYLYKEK